MWILYEMKKGRAVSVWKDTHSSPKETVFPNRSDLSPQILHGMTEIFVCFSVTVAYLEGQH